MPSDTLTVTLIRVLAPRCAVCGEQAELLVPKAGFDRWRAGEYIQIAFPHMSADDRELLISGTHPACWNKLYGSGEE